MPLEGEVGGKERLPDVFCRTLLLVVSLVNDLCCSKWPDGMNVLYSLREITGENPELRNGILYLANTCAKEIDRSLQIMESVRFVKIWFSHRSLLLYKFEEGGKDLLMKPSEINSIFRRKYYTVTMC